MNNSIEWVGSKCNIASSVDDDSYSVGDKEPCVLCPDSHCIAFVRNKLSDYEKFKSLKIDLYENGTYNHNPKRHPMSVRIGEFLNKMDYNDYQDGLGLRFGGDGDNGEVLLDQLDAFFMTIDLEEKFQTK